MKRICLIYIFLGFLPFGVQSAPLSGHRISTNRVVSKTVEALSVYQDKKRSKGSSQKDDGKQKVKQVPKAKRQSKPTPVKPSSKGKEKSSDKNNSRKR